MLSPVDPKEPEQAEAMTNSASATTSNAASTSNGENSMNDRERGLVDMLEQQRKANEAMMMKFEQEMALMKRQSNEREQKLERLSRENDNLANRTRFQPGQRPAATSNSVSSIPLPTPMFPMIFIPEPIAQPTRSVDVIDDVQLPARVMLDRIAHLVPTAATNTVMVILKTNYPNDVVSEDEFENIQKRCNDALAASVEDIKVDSISHKQGIVAVTCLNVATIRWLIVVMTASKWELSVMQQQTGT